MAPGASAVRPSPERLFAEAYRDAQRWARSIVRRWGHSSTTWDGDVEGAALERLWLCAVRYDPSRGVPFSAYWRLQVNRAMIDELRRLFPGGRGGTVLLSTDLPDIAAALSLKQDIASSPEEIAVANAGLASIAAAAATLCPADREVVAACNEEGGQLLLAKRCGVTQSAITWRKRATRRRLRSLLAA